MSAGPWGRRPLSAEQEKQCLFDVPSDWKPMAPARTLRAPPAHPGARAAPAPATLQPSQLCSGLLSLVYTVSSSDLLVQRGGSSRCLGHSCTAQSLVHPSGFKKGVNEGVSKYMATPGTASMRTL